MLEEEKKETKELTEEEKLQEKREKEKKILSASPGAVDSSSIDVNATNVENIASESNVVSETVVDTDAKEMILEKEEKQNQTIQEVSVTVEANSLDVKPEETSEGSVFNKKEEKVSEEPAKLGEDTQTKKRFPFFMVLFFIILIVIAFNIDKVSIFIKEYINGKEQPIVEENKPVKKEEIKVLTLVEIKKALENSKYITNFETNNSIKIQISTDEEKELTISTTDYLSSGIDPLAIEYKLDTNVISATCENKVSSYCTDINNFVLIETLKLRGDTNTNILDDIKVAITTATIDKNGFSMTVGDTGVVSYSISLDKELVYEKTESTKTTEEEPINNEGQTSVTEKTEKTEEQSTTEENKSNVDSQSTGNNTNN